MTPEPMIVCTSSFVTFRMPLALFVGARACEDHPGESWVTIRSEGTPWNRQWVRRVPFDCKAVLDAVERARKERDAAQPSVTITAARFVDLGGDVHVRPELVTAVDRMGPDSCCVYCAGESLTVDRPAADVVADLERALDARPE